MEKIFRYFLLATTIVIFLLVVMGNVVRVSNASLACPDWPTCFGQFSFPENSLAQLQVIHRGLAGLATLMVAVAAAWAARRHTRRIILLPLAAAVPMMMIQVVLGAGLVAVQAPAVLGALHLGLALAVLALASMATTAVYGQDVASSPQVVLPGWAVQNGVASESFGEYAAILSGDSCQTISAPAQARSERFVFRSPFARLSLAAAASVFLVMVSGAAVVASESAQTAPTSWIEIGHQGITALAGVLMTLAFFQAWRTQRSQRVVLAAATGGFILFAGQVLIGAAKVSRAFPADLVGLHAASAAALWAVLAVWVTAVGLTGRSSQEEAAEAAQAAPVKQHMKDFYLLNKPVIVLLLLVTTYAGMVLGGHRLPGAALTVWTMLGGALAAGGASALNQYIDRELDKNMQRTARRPLPSGRMMPAEGLAYGLGACLASFFIMAVFVNLLAALLSLAGMIYYVLLYSIWLKKLTVQNIVIGGGAGAIPPLVGWAAASGGLNIPSIFLFAIVFLWTPPHFWALALVRRNDYARAGVPMLPVVQGEKATRWQIFLYTLELVGLTLLMPALHLTGSIFFFSALGLGAWLISAAWRVWKKGGNKTAWMMYRYSSMYLAFIFLALVLDVLL
jgi:protoheme IX farnesyltransferase